MSHVITAPESLPAKFERTAVFLAGSIDSGSAEHWQHTFIAACQREPVILLNPRREHWVVSAAPHGDNRAFREQVEWELRALEQADIVAMYFAPESRAPVSLLELGLWARSGKVMVACPDGYWKKGNVEIVCARYQIPLFNNLNQLIHAVCVRASHTRPAVQKLHTSKFLALVKEGHWEYVDRVNATGAALILAVTPEQKVLLVEQFRIPLHARSIELPAGIIGDEPGKAGELQAEAARRELLEETGYAAEKIEALTTGPACSGITSERVTLFRASGLQRAGKGGGVAHEDITVHEVPLGETAAWLEAKAKSGVLIDPKVYAGLFFLGRE
jgi:ADP-ribose pyrophosphatase